MLKPQSRQRTRNLRVPVLPNEEADIKNNAANCGLSTAAYLRALGLNYTPKTMLDNQTALELLKLGADMGRVGGLLKMWLTNDDRLKSMGKDKVKPIIEGLLNDLKDNQTLIMENIKKL